MNPGPPSPRRPRLPLIKISVYADETSVGVRQAQADIDPCIDLWEQSMDGADSVNDHAASTDQRRYPRYVVDGDSALVFTDLGLTRQCKIIDLSVGGCRIAASERLPAKAGTRVETAFKVNGMAFRFNGVLRWTDGRRQAGIQFIGMIPRCCADLAELIGEIQTAPPKETPTEEDPTPASSPPPAATSQAAKSQGASPQGTKPLETKVDRRAQARHAVDTSATIILIRGGVPLTGRILDLSLGGCRVRTRENFPVGIRTPVETEFRLRGMPFRLGGVIQAIHNRDTVGVQFIDMSDRKRQQVSALIAEIEQARQRQNPASTAETAQR
jgi:hypothetical protein